jgi:hypothetical protein
VLSEAVAAVLIPALGRGQAQDVARRAVQTAAATGPALTEAVLARPEVAALVSSGHLDPGRVAEVTTPDGYLGSADAIIDRVLAGSAVAAPPTDPGPEPSTDKMTVQEGAHPRIARGRQRPAGPAGPDSEGSSR